MATYIGSKRVDSVSSYNKLSTREKTYASRSPEVLKILTGKPTTAQVIKSRGTVKRVSDVNKYVAQVEQQNYKILADTQARMIESFSKKYEEAGRGFDQQGKNVPLVQQPTQNNTGMLILAGIVAIGLLK